MQFGQSVYSMLTVHTGRDATYWQKNILNKTADVKLLRMLILDPMMLSNIKPDWLIPPNKKKVMEFVNCFHYFGKFIHFKYRKHCCLSHFKSILLGSCLYENYFGCCCSRCLMSKSAQAGRF